MNAIALASVQPPMEAERAALSAKRAIGGNYKRKE